MPKICKAPEKWVESGIPEWDRSININIGLIMQFFLRLQRPAVKNLSIGVSGLEKFIDYFALS